LPVLDQFDAQETPAVQQAANSLSIELLLFSRGGTDRYKLPNRRTFGALKTKGRAKWIQQHVNHSGMICTREQAARLLLACWDDLARKSLLCGWDLDHTNSDEDFSSDNSEDEWSLEVKTSDDQDLNDDSDSCLDELIEIQWLDLAMACVKKVSPFFDVTFLTYLLFSV
jgi:hypothetical protein